MNITPSDYILGFIAFTFIIVGSMAILTEVQNDDSTFINTTQYSEFNHSFNKMNDLTTSVGGLKSGITGDSTKSDYGALGVLNALVSTGWNSLTLIFSSFGFIEDVFNSMSTFFGVPAWIPALIILAITVILVFAIFSAIFQREV